MQYYNSIYDVQFHSVDTLQLALDAESTLAVHSSLESADDFLIKTKQKKKHPVQQQYDEGALDLNDMIGEGNLMYQPETTTPATIISDDNGKEPTVFILFIL